MKKILTLLLFIPLCNAFGQDTLPAQAGKKIIDHTTYDGWRSVTTPVISNDGQWISHEINPQVGDGKLFLYNAQTNATDSFDRGKSPVFLYTGDGYLVYKQVPLFKTTRKAKLDKKKPEDMPKDTLVVYNLKSKAIVKLGNVKSFSVNDYCNYVVAHLGKEKKPAVKLSKRQIKRNKKHPPIEVKSDGTTLVAWDPVTGKQQRYSNVIEYSQASKSAPTAFVVQQKGKNDSSFVYTISNSEGANGFKREKIFEIKGWSKNLAIDEGGKNIGFIATTDTNKIKTYCLYYKGAAENIASKILDTSSTSISKKLTVSENAKPYFSPDGGRLYFGIAALPKQEPKDTLLDDEKYNLDIWHWNDERVQPEQIKQADKDKKSSYLTCYTTSSKNIVQIENDTLKVHQFVQRGNGNTVLLANESKTRKTATWESQPAVDYYLRNLDNGSAQLLLEGKTHPVGISHTGKYIVWYDPIKKDWFTMNIAKGERYLITGTIDDNLFEDNNGVNEYPYPFGVMGWSKNDEYVYIYSEFEIWKIQPETNEKVICLTKNKGGEYNTDLRYVRLDRDQEYIDDNWLLLRSFNHHNKREGFWAYNNGIIQPLLIDDYKYTFLGKAKNSDRILYSKMDFQTYPDVLMNDLTFKNEKRITNANPQQSQYLWGTVELVKWKTFEGHDLEGLLYKPENFDESKKYPLIVYFYEKNADGLHLYKSPRPSASVINFSEYVSNGYVIFIPDIVYKLGDPGKSAFDCIVSGTKNILEKGFIDEKKVALQGQSWGGYQTAYLVTQTSMYTCAFAGAPVGNMTSAYTGVRWESGLLRTFQYEHGQSRIGKTLWEDRDAYIRNSPVFFLDKVKTPLLLMNNDADGAVPWYQGIEIYGGLRRLEKPVWLLNYNGDGHNLTRRANQIDLSRRMLQFFNHYLKDAAMPEWMKEGVPAVNKGKVTGYDLK